MNPKNTNKFHWVEEDDTVVSADNRKFYKKCILGDTVLCCNDFVLVNNYDDPENENLAYVAKILQMYQMDSKIAPYRAIVSWFSRHCEIPKKILNQDSASTTSCYNNSNEIFLNTMNFQKNIDIETIFKKIQVQESPSTTGEFTNHTKSPNRLKTKIFTFNGHSYDGKKIINKDTEENVENNTTGFNLLSRSGRKLKKIILDLSPDILYDMKDRKKTPSSPSLLSEKSRQSRRRSLFTQPTTATVTPTKQHIAKTGRSAKCIEDTNITRKTPSKQLAKAKNTPNKRRKSSNITPSTKHSNARKPSKKTIEYKDDDDDDDDKNDDDDNDDDYIASISNDDDDEEEDDNISNDDLVETGSSSSALSATVSNKKKFTKIKPKNTHKGSKKASQAASLNSGKTATRVKSDDRNKSNLEIIRERLHLAAVPDVLPCREEEFADVYQFVRDKIMDSIGGCMYISGVPGTGKTATIRQVVSVLEEESKLEDLPNFKFIEINGMQLVDPHHANVEILKQLTGQKATPEHACSLLDKRFKTDDPHRIPVILLVDELDMLWTRKQTVMYNLFDWPTHKSSKLIVIAIANTMDLPERMMMTRVASRLGLTRLTFQPYNHHQLQEIVLSRIKGYNAFDEDAVQLVARKVAALSGDARRALEICRRSTELVSGEEKMVTMAHVDSAIQEMFYAPKMMAVRYASLHEKMFLKALLSEFQRIGIEEAVLVNVFKQHISLCRFESLDPPTMSQVSAICNRLSGFKLLLTDSARNDIHQKIRLNISQDDLSYALKHENIPS